MRKEATGKVFADLCLPHSHSHWGHESFLELEFQGEIAMVGTPQSTNQLEGFYITNDEESVENGIEAKINFT